MAVVLNVFVLMEIRAISNAMDTFLRQKQYSNAMDRELYPKKI